MFLLWILLSIAATIAVWLGFWAFVNLIVNRGDHHKQFVNGKIPETAPDGFYQGTAHIFLGFQTPWLGKSFAADSNLGFNIFMPKGAALLRFMMPLYKRFSLNKDGNTNAFYFQTRIAAGLKDKQLQVIKLDYDAPENPFPIRIILDEIVEIAADEFLGKIHLKIFPRFSSTIGYFGLKKFQAPGSRFQV